jgi:transcriptional regulator with AAA-type ATPase domain
LLARAIHGLSGRHGPLVPVNCGGIPPTLVEGELFGHKKGAFSGADQDRLGLVRASDGGTLFLDEIGDLPSAAQAALLRVLQESEVLPVGGHRAQPLDCGSSQPPTAIWTSWSRRGSSVTTSSRGWMESRSSCRRCGSGGRTSL